MKIALIRGRYLNKYEMQTYEPLAARFDLTGFSSLKPIHSEFKFPVVKLASPMDLPNFPYKMPILNRIFGDAQILFGLENKLRGFDIAHGAETYFYFTQQCLNAKSQGLVKKVVSTVWENIPFNNEGIRKRKEFKKRAIKEVDYFIAVTELAKEALIKEGCNLNKISVIYPGINLNKFQMTNKNLAFGKNLDPPNRQIKQISNKFPMANKQIKILFVGRLEKEKGVLELLSSFKILKLKIKNLKLKIIGNGSLKNYLAWLINRWCLNKEVEIGEANYNKMPEIYQSADIFVLPSKSTKSWQEQFGMVLIEAMASGLPVIASRSGAIPEVVGETGILVEERNNADLVKAIKTVVDNNDLRISLRKKGRERVEKLFDAKKQAQKIADIYEVLIN